MTARGWLGTGILVIALCAGFGAATGAAASRTPASAKGGAQRVWPDAFAGLALPR